MNRAICAKVGGQMHHGHAEMKHDQVKHEQVETGSFLRDVIIMMNKDIKRMSGT